MLERFPNLKHTRTEKHKHDTVPIQILQRILTSCRLSHASPHKRTSNHTDCCSPRTKPHKDSPLLHIDLENPTKQCIPSFFGFSGGIIFNHICLLGRNPFRSVRLRTCVCVQDNFLTSPHPPFSTRDRHHAASEMHFLESRGWPNDQTKKEAIPTPTAVDYSGLGQNVLLNTSASTPQPVLHPFWGW